MIRTDRLAKGYGPVQALRPLTLEVAAGELFGLIGPDGAGKTTLFRLLATLLTPDGGDASVAGLDLRRDYRQIRSVVGYMPGRFSLYPDLSVDENLAFFASLFGVKTSPADIAAIRPIYAQIAPFGRRRAGKLSGGMKQKLALCCSLIHHPTLLLLDEPTTGVDAVSRSEFWDMLAELRNGGLTIMVSTPYMDEARRCDRIALIDRGEVLAVDTPAAIVAACREPLYAVSAADPYRLLRECRRLTGVADCYTFGAAHHLLAAPGFDPDEASAALAAAGLTDVAITPTRPDIEDVFIKLMRR